MSSSSEEEEQEKIEFKEKKKKRKKEKKDKKKKKQKKQKKEKKEKKEKKSEENQRKRTRAEYDASSDPVAQMYSSVASWSAAKEVSLAQYSGGGGGGGGAYPPAGWPPAKARKPNIIELTIDDRLGKKVKVKCAANDTVGELKLAIAGETGTRPEKIKLVRAQVVLKDGIRLDDYEIHSGSGIELYYL